MIMRNDCSEIVKKNSPTKEATIIIPFFNEKNSIPTIVEQILCPEFLEKFEIIFVEDGSTDGTRELLASLNKKRREFILLNHEENLGYGASLKTGIRHATTDTIIITDADQSYPNDRIPELHAIFSDGHYDMVVGARTKSGVKIPIIRRPAKWFLNFISRCLVSSKIPDVNSGLRVFRKDVVLEYFNLLCDGFSFTTTLTLIMFCNGYRVNYVSIEYFKRVDKSKIRPIKDTMNFILLVVTTVLYFNPLKILLPPGMLLISFGFIAAVVQAILIRNITTSVMLLISTGLTIMSIALIADLIVKSRPVKPSGNID
jgi:glycosyltransferase involved in cell wall biosynthesis